MFQQLRMPILWLRRRANKWQLKPSKAVCYFLIRTHMRKRKEFVVAIARDPWWQISAGSGLLRTSMAKQRFSSGSVNKVTRCARALTRRPTVR